MTSSALIHSTSYWWNSTSKRGPNRCALCYWVGTGVHNRGPLPESKIVSLDKAPHDSAKNEAERTNARRHQRSLDNWEIRWATSRSISWTMENIKMKEIEGYIARHGKYLVIGHGKCRIAFMMSPSPIILRSNGPYNFSPSISHSVEKGTCCYLLNKTK